MTECCLFVCCRPVTSDRLITALYPKDSTGYEEKLTPLKLHRLIEYSNSYPKKLQYICEHLKDRILKDYSQKKYGYVLIGMETFRHLCQECRHLDHLITINTSLMKCFHFFFKKYELKYLNMIYSVFVDYTDCQISIHTLSQYFQPILELCSPPSPPSSSSSSSSPSPLSEEIVLIGLKYLFRLLCVLTPSSGEIERQFPHLIPLLCFYHSNPQCFSSSSSSSTSGAGEGRGPSGIGASRTRGVVAPTSAATATVTRNELETKNELFVDDDGTLTTQGLAASCLEILLRNPSPTTSSRALRLVFRLWDQQLWDPIDAIRSSLVWFQKILNSSSHCHPSLSSLLISHASNTLTNSSITLPSASPPPSSSSAPFSCLPLAIFSHSDSGDQRGASLTIAGSEYFIRTFPPRSLIITRILTLVTEIFFPQPIPPPLPPPPTLASPPPLSVGLVMENLLSSDESIIHTLRLLMDSLVMNHWRDTTSMLLRSFTQLAHSYQETNSLLLSSSERLACPINNLQTFLFHDLQLKTQQLPTNKLRVDRLYTTTPSMVEMDESCYTLFLATMRCYQAIIPTLPSAKKALSVIFYFNDLILSSPATTTLSSSPTTDSTRRNPKATTTRPSSSSRLLVLLFSLHTILTQFILTLRTEMKACGVTDLTFSLHHLLLSRQQLLRTPSLSAFLTSLFSFFSSISSTHLFLHTQSSSSSSLPHSHSPYILLSSQQLCQYLSLFVQHSSSSLTPSTEDLMIQTLLVTVLQEIFFVERVISFLFTLVTLEKSKHTHPSILSLLSSPSPSHSPSFSINSPLTSSTPLSLVSPSGVSSVVVSQKNQILRDFLFHQLCNQTNNGPDHLPREVMPRTTGGRGEGRGSDLLSTGRMYLCKVQMMWNLQVSSTLLLLLHSL
jgi:hypothetical protein